MDADRYQYLRQEQLAFNKRLIDFLVRRSPEPAKWDDIRAVLDCDTLMLYKQLRELQSDRKIYITREGWKVTEYGRENR